MGILALCRRLSSCNGRVHISTKRRSDSKLFFPHHAPYFGRGRLKVFGEKVNIRTLSDPYCVQTTEETHTNPIISVSGTGQGEYSTVKYCDQTDYAPHQKHAFDEQRFDVICTVIGGIVRLAFPNRVQFPRCQTAFWAGRFHEYHANSGQ